MELVVVIAVIGLIAAIALPSVSKVTEKARKAAAQKNAQMICSLHSSARSAGAGFASGTRDGILDELVAGVTGTLVETSFQMSALDDVDKAEALKYCAFDGVSDMMNYYPEGDAPEDTGVENEWEENWQLFGVATYSTALDLLNSGAWGEPGYEYRGGAAHESDPQQRWVDRRKL